MPSWLDDLGRGIRTTLKNPQDYLNKFVISVVIIALCFAMYWLLYYLFIQHIKNLKTRIRTKKLIKNTLRVLTVLGILFTWMHAINALVLLILIVILFIVTMIRGLTDNIIAWFLITRQHFFSLGDRIEIDGMIGEVLKVGFSHFQLLEMKNWLSSESYTGRVIDLPNQIILENTVYNYTTIGSYVWKEVEYALTFDSDWETAKSLMLEACNDYYRATIEPEINQLAESQPHKVSIADFHPVFTMNVSDTSIILAVRYPVDYRRASAVQTELNQTILRLFAKEPAITFTVVEVRMVP